MRSTEIIILLAIALFVNARGVKRQKKITRVVSKQAPRRGCQVSVLELPSSKSLLESTYGCLGTSGCPGTCDCPSTCGCPTSCGCPSTCGCLGDCQSVFLEELPCGCNYACNCDGYGILNAEVSSYDRIPAIRLPKTLASVDTRIPVPAINLPTLYQCDVPSCQCQNALPYQILDSPCNRPSFEFLNPIDVPSPILKMPAESMIQTFIIETPRPVMKLPICGQMPVEVCGCQREKCGCQLSALDIPCSCQMSTLGSCGCQLSALDMPCSCQLPAYNLPCGCQLPGLDCGCQFQAFNSPCQAPIGSPCGCQLPVPNVPYAYLLPKSDAPCAYQLPNLDVPCGCQLPSCGCQLIPPPAVGCGKYLRQVTLQPPFL